MSRAALSKTKKIIVSAAVVVLAAGGGTWAYIANSPDHKTNTTVNAQHQLTQLSYQGKNGVDALTLLKRHATVKTKHYSFGDMVTSINGTPSTSSKYWTLYVNNKMSQVGASSYITKDSDTISWRLQ